MTGFQKYHFSQDQNVHNVSSVLGKGNKLLYLTKSLTGALDCYKNKKQVSMLASLRKFRTVFDTKRIVIPDPDSTFLSSIPYTNMDDARFDRMLMVNAIKSGTYSSAYHSGVYALSSSSVTETLKQYVRAILCHLRNNYTDFHVDQVFSVLPPNVCRIKSLHRIFSDVLLEKGHVLNDMGIFASNKKFLASLHKNLVDYNGLFVRTGQRDVLNLLGIFQERFKTLL
jgi:hypothetical protein